MTEPEWKITVDSEYIDEWNTSFRVKRTRGDVVEWYRQCEGTWVSDTDKVLASVWYGVMQAAVVRLALIDQYKHKLAWEKVPPFRQHITGWGIEDGGRELFDAAGETK